MLFNLVFASNYILSCFFSFFLVIDLCILIPDPISELVISIGIMFKETKAEIEIKL